jgi:hypothetical protein
VTRASPSCQVRENAYAPVLNAFTFSPFMELLRTKRILLLAHLYDSSTYPIGPTVYQSTRLVATSCVKQNTSLFLEASEAGRANHPF